MVWGRGVGGGKEGGGFRMGNTCIPVVDSFCFQDFGSFSLSLFGILYQVDSLSLSLLFGLVGIYPVPLSAGYSSVSSSCLNC